MTAYDNALMDSTIGLFNSEEIDRPRMRTFASWKEVERATAEWVNWYNTERLHGLHQLHPADRIRGLLVSDGRNVAQFRRSKCSPSLCLLA
ncbi:integrase core domain-containing protein [Corynebacterium propinquum]|uniref:integrase core domain-containing protein n=2 Tax=Corynebacterium propinquum TaxID=43769 RepID=UPI003D6CA2B9